MEEQENTPIQKGKYGIGALIVTAFVALTLGVGVGSNLADIDFGQTYESANRQLPEDLEYGSVEELYDELRNQYAGELSEEELLNGLKFGLVEAAGDPYSEYLTAEQADELDLALKGEFSGIGAEIGIEDDQLIVIAPIEGTPADKAGLRPQDMILQVDGEDTGRMNLQEAVSRIRGEAGTEVVLTIARKGEAQPLEVKIIRATIELPNLEYELLEGNVGYIRLIQFSSEAPAEFRKAAQDLKSRGAKKIILDVRNNPGGYLDVAVDISSEFLPAGTPVVDERRDGKVIGSEVASSGGVLVGMPTAVLINRGSASASEIIAGALRDHGVATLVGEQSFGKGSVQQLIPLDSGGMLRVTIANWHTPEGDNISEEGVEPDKKVELTGEDIKKERDPQLDLAKELLSKE